ncbi:hypothetical protein D030_4759B, partial [Vibrio parahaemolyticus AQ3810]
KVTTNSFPIKSPGRSFLLCRSVARISILGYCAKNVEKSGVSPLGR